MGKYFKLKLFLILWALPYDLSVASSDCTLQPQLGQIQKEMGRVRPDPMNEKTIGAQDKIVDRVIALVKKLSACSLREGELTDLVKLMVRTMAYDPDNQLGDQIGSSIKGAFQDKLINRAKDMEKKRLLSRQQLLEFVAAITVATEAESSQDDEAPAEDEVGAEENV